MSANVCNDVSDYCLSGTFNARTSGGGHTTITQKKNRSIHMQVGNTTIVIRSLARDFRIHYIEDWDWAGIAIKNVTDLETYFCGERTGTGHGEISENITNIDTELFYLDPVNKIAFWRERTETCVFNYNTTKAAMLRAPYGTFYAWWFEVYPTRTCTDRYKLLVNEEVVTIETVVQEVAVENVINILFPLPPSDCGPTGDPTDYPENFYDYYMDEQLRELDGGIDWYYPSWQRQMGIDNSENIADAMERYTWWLNHKVVEDTDTTFPMPRLPSAIPAGNAVVDAKGNILVSVKGYNVTLNKLYLNNDEHTVIDLNAISESIIPGEHMKLYPVSLI